MSADWIVTVRCVLRNMIEHNEPGAADIVRYMIDSEGLHGLCDPEDMTVVGVEPAMESTPTQSCLAETGGKEG